MLTLKLISENEQELVFNYHPEGNSEFGTIVVNKRSEELHLLHDAENDEFGIYKVHAVSKIKEYLQNKVFLKETTVAWY